MTSRKLVSRWRPPGFSGGSKSLISFHCLFVRSVGGKFHRKPKVDNSSRENTEQTEQTETVWDLPSVPSVPSVPYSPLLPETVNRRMKLAKDFHIFVAERSLQRHCSSQPL